MSCGDRVSVFDAHAERWRAGTIVSLGESVALVTTRAGWSAVVPTVPRWLRAIRVVPA